MGRTKPPGGQAASSAPNGKGSVVEVKPGYKRTELGVIPEDWEILALGDLAEFITSGSRGWAEFYSDSGALFIRSQNVRDGRLSFDDTQYIRPPLGAEGNRTKVILKDILITITGNSVGNVALVEQEFEEAYISQHVGMVRLYEPELGSYVCRYLSPHSPGNPQISGNQSGQSKPGLNLQNLRDFKIAIPSTDSEQHAIASALSDVDALLDGLDRLIAKKRDLKQAAMQQLLTGKTRLPGFSGEWEVETIEAIAECLDDVRVPLNEVQRAQMRGDIPYCGANGVLDFVNDYVINDDVILMAEDGGYFEEYETRPIAYRMKGKCWINNHAHILKANPNCDQGFLFNSLVHKNILPFLASGTRAKLNKSEMNKIEIRVPAHKEEQSAIATVLSDMDAELTALEARRDKTRELKQAMMQELLTGRIRLV